MNFDDVTRFSQWTSVNITPESDGIAGVYFLINDAGDVVYVGQSICPRYRVAQHVNEGVKQFSEARLLPVMAKDLDEVETAFIHLFAPPLNERVTAMTAAKISAVVKRFGIEADEHAIKPHKSLTGPVRIDDAAKRLKLTTDELRCELNDASVRIRYSPSLDTLVVGKSDFTQFLEARARRSAA